MPTIQKIPEKRIEPVYLENRLPDGDMPSGAVEDRLKRCEDKIIEVNADRKWIRCRQEPERSECGEQ